MRSTSRASLIQVVPQLAPGRNGVSDHATELERALRKDFGVESAFAVVNGKVRPELPYRWIECHPADLRENCLKLTEGGEGAIIVHVSGYGYSPDGAPMQIADSLEKVKADGRFRIAIYFHELYAFGLPWRSAFWHSSRQRRALRKLVASADLILTNTTRHQKWLSRASERAGGVQAEMIPVFSTVGETPQPVPMNERNAAMVILGLPGTRRLAYRRIAQSGNLLRTLGIEEIYDIGADNVHPSQVNGVRVKRMGLLPVEEVPAVYSQARFGFVVHPWHVLGKSSVLASYCAHGVIPVVTKPFSGVAEGLRDGVHVVSARTAMAVQQAGWEACSRAARTWYGAHCLRVHAARYAKWISERA